MHITKISATQQVTLVTFEKFPSNISYLAKLFSLLGEHNINVDMISQTAPKGNNVTICFTVFDDDVTNLLVALAPLREKLPEIKPFIVSNNVKISLFGEDLPKYAGISGKAFKTLNDKNIDINLISTSEVDISFLISNEVSNEAISALENAFNVKL